MDKNFHLTRSAFTFILLVGLIGIGCAPKKIIQPTTPPKPVKPYIPTIPVTTSKGISVTAHPYASQTSASILKQGGNAAAAGITALATLSVAEPHASGLGGGGFALYYDSKAQLVRLVDYRETAPANIDVEMYYQPTDSFRIKLQFGGTSVLVPGAPSGWQKLYQSFSNKPLNTLLAPAIHLADTGYSPSEKQQRMILDYADQLSENELLSELYLDRDEDLNPLPKQRIRFPALSKSYQVASEKETFSVFTDSIIGLAMVNALNSNGGSFTLQDLKNYEARFIKPLIFNYRGYEIYTVPMPSAGGTAVAIALKMLENYNLKEMGWQSPAHLHTVAEAIRQGMTDGIVWGGDPNFVKVYTDSLLSKSNIQKVVNQLPKDSVRMRAVPYDTATSHGNTTHLVIADKDGNLLSLTQSINYFFGSKLYDPVSGVLFNNHAADFDMRSSGRRNSIAPNHKPSSWMSPVIILKDKKPILIAGTPGGPRIPAVMVELITALIDFELPLNKAIDAPRFFPNGKRFEYEARLPESSLADLKKLGWELKPKDEGDSYFGGAQAIQFLPDGTKLGVGDTRRDGTPVVEE